MAVILAITQWNEIDFSDPKTLGCFFYEFSFALILATPNWCADDCKRGRHGEVLPSFVHSEVLPRYVEEF